MKRLAPDALAAYQPYLERHVRRMAGLRLTRYEALADLVQGVLLRALKALPDFEYRSERELLGWLKTLARHHVLDRVDHWKAVRRNCGRVIRLVETESRGFDPSDHGTSPSSRAARREQIVLVTRAMEGLRSRDRALLEKSARGASIEDLAEELGISYESAKKARQRAIERLQKAHRLLLQSRGAGRGFPGSRPVP